MVQVYTHEQYVALAIKIANYYFDFTEQQTVLSIWIYINIDLLKKEVYSSARQSFPNTNLDISIAPWAVVVVIDWWLVL